MAEPEFKPRALWQQAQSPAHTVTKGALKTLKIIIIILILILILVIIAIIIDSSHSKNFEYDLI